MDPLTATDFTDSGTKKPLDASPGAVKLEDVRGFRGRPGETTHGPKRPRFLSVRCRAPLRERSPLVQSSCQTRSELVLSCDLMGPCGSGCAPNAKWPGFWRQRSDDRRFQNGIVKVVTDQFGLARHRSEPVGENRAKMRARKKRADQGPGVVRWGDRGRPCPPISMFGTNHQSGRTPSPLRRAERLVRGEV